MRNALWVIIFTALICSSLCLARDDQLLGSWKAVTYNFEKQDYPLEGLMIFTPKYFSANVIFRATGGDSADANANAGPYRSEKGKLIFTQWMQLHVRPGDPGATFLAQGVDEEASYRIEGDRLLITFPSGNVYILERLAE